MLMVYVWYFLKWEMLDLISETVLPIVMDHLPNSDMVFELTGIAAYLGNKLRIVDIFATVLSGLILTFAISAIKK